MCFHSIRERDVTVMQAAILIIGSLLWDHRNGRDKWRKSHLRVDLLQHVRVPIRYGRCSHTRGNTYTMTFASDHVMGHGVLVPCKSPLPTADALICEVEELWQAESTNANKGDISAGWGCVGILFRPQGTPSTWRQEWGDYFCKKKANVVPPISSDGLLGIPWPVKVSDGNEVDVDVILATATRADSKLPSTDDIADAWISQSNSHERYFFENVRCGIQTPDDKYIWRRIEERKPVWMNKREYAKAVSLLRQ